MVKQMHKMGRECTLVPGRCSPHIFLDILNLGVSFGLQLLLKVFVARIDCHMDAVCFDNVFEGNPASNHRHSEASI